MKGSPKHLQLSKSKILTGLQCPKDLYLNVHCPDLEAKVSDWQQSLFDQGHEAGFEAQRRYPGGIAIDAAFYDSDLAFKLPGKAIANGSNTV